MDQEQLRQRFTDITIWSRGSERAPHKPLLLLYALGKCNRGEPRQIPYADIDPKLRDLLIEFGPSRKAYHPEYPFWRLQNDGIWELENAENAEPRASNKGAKKSELLRYGVTGGFTPAIYETLHKGPTLIGEIALAILEQHFPTSLHEDILQAVGLDVQFEKSTRRKRDPEFRSRVLTAYEYRCAFCGFDVRLGNHDLGLEAAHIRWHQAGGPDIEANGLALCVLHHKLFDRGAMGILPSNEVIVSQQAHGTKGFDEWLLAFHGRPIRPPQDPAYLPCDQHVGWHLSEVFKDPARHRN